MISTCGKRLALGLQAVDGLLDLSSSGEGTGPSGGSGKRKRVFVPEDYADMSFAGSVGPDGAKQLKFTYGGVQSDTFFSIFPGVFRPARKSIPFCMVRLLLDQLGIVDMSVLIEGEKFVEEPVAGMQGGHWTIRHSFPTQ